MSTNAVDLNDEFDVVAGEEKAPRRNKPAKPAHRQMRRIIVDESEYGENDILVGVNGKQYQIMRGIEVEVPQEVVNALRLAVGTRYVKVIDPETKQEYLQPRQYSSVPWRLVG